MNNCSNCFFSHMWNLINEHLFVKQDFINIRISKELNTKEGINYMVYNAICNYCKKPIQVKECLFVITNERLEYLNNKLCQWNLTKEIAN